MKSRRILVLFLIAALQASGATAQVYQWKDSAGRTIISDTPPPTTTRASRTYTAGPAADSAGVAVASPPKTATEKEKDFRKRQQEVREKAEKENKEQLAAAARQDNCDRAKRYLASLEAEEPIVIREQNGERRILDGERRQQEADRARGVMAENCR